MDIEEIVIGPMDEPWDTLDINAKMKGVHNQKDPVLQKMWEDVTAKIDELDENIEAEKNALMYLVEAGVIEDESKLDEVPIVIDLEAKKARLKEKKNAMQGEKDGRAAGKFGPGFEYDREYID
jgi:hypothetical protein